MKKLLLGVIIVLLGVIGYMVWKDGQPVEYTSNTEEIPAEIVPEQAPENSEILGGEEERALPASTSKYLKIDAKYPAFENPATSKIVKNFIDDQFEIYKKESSFENLPQSEMDRMDENGSQYEFIISYEIFRTEHTASILFSIYAYNGGAHGGHTLRSLNFTDGDRLFTLGELFIPGTNYLSKLSELARAKLPVVLGENPSSWMNDGTTPITTNFDTFYLTPGELHIAFQPYQVAPWASGAPEIKININNELRDLMSPNFANE